MFTLSVIFVPHFPTGKCKYDESHMLLIGTFTTSFYHTAGQTKDAFTIVSSSSITAQKQDVYLNSRKEYNFTPKGMSRAQLQHCHVTLPLLKPLPSADTQIKSDLFLIQVQMQQINILQKRLDSFDGSHGGKGR